MTCVYHYRPDPGRAVKVEHDNPKEPVAAVFMPHSCGLQHVNWQSGNRHLRPPDEARTADVETMKACVATAGRI